MVREEVFSQHCIKNHVMKKEETLSCDGTIRTKPI